MKKYFLLIAFTSLLWTDIKSQSCLPEGIHFFSQTSIDNFQSNYPNCKKIEGDVTIEGNNINNLNGLSVLDSIGESLYIYNTSNLNNLTGLNNLKSIDGTLRIEKSNKLIDFMGLDSLSSIGNSIIIYDNDNLKNLKGLQSIEYVPEILSIHGNSSLSNLEGLNNLREVDFGFQISANDSLKTLYGLESLETVADLIIKNNPRLKTLSGLNGLNIINGTLTIINSNSLIKLQGLNNVTSIAGALYIYGNPSLKNLTGLDKLKEVGGLYLFSNKSLINLKGLDSLKYNNSELIIVDNESLNELTSLKALNSTTSMIKITNNASLKSLIGLDNIYLSGMEEIWIFNNPMLSTCEAKSICNYLSNLFNPYSVIIQDNAEGCNDTTEVKEKCNANSLDENKPSCLFTIYPNPASDYIYVLPKINDKIKEINILNQLGQLEVHHVDITKKIITSNLQSGVYFISIITESSNFREKIIISK